MVETLSELVRGESLKHPALTRGEISFDELAAEYLARTGRQPRLLPLPVGGKVAAAFKAGLHIDEGSSFGTITWEQYLDRRLG